MQNTDKTVDNARILEQRIRVLLDKAGIPVDLCGYEYLLTAIEIMCELPHTQTVKLVSFLYARIASQYETNLASVERGMRFAINAAWKKNVDNMKHIIRVNCRPTVGRFIIKMTYIVLDSI